MTFQTVEKELIPILKSDQVARCDDMALYANYAYTKIKGMGLSDGWMQKIFSDRRFRLAYGIAPYETVSRIRRKLQAKYTDLRANAEIKAERKRIEQQYKEYARKGAKNEHSGSDYTNNLRDTHSVNVDQQRE